VHWAGQVSAQTGSVDDSAKAEGGAFAVEPLHTRVLFGVSHFGFTTYYGEFSGVSGTLDLDPKNPCASKLDIRIPAASISTTNAELNGELKGEEWFDTAKYPNISFKATKVTMTGPGKADVVAISLCMERRSLSFCKQYSTGQGSIRSTSTIQWA
jgi:polyisoprenoid-binding protein YceI